MSYLNRSGQILFVSVLVSIAQSSQALAVPYLAQEGSVSSQSSSSSSESAYSRGIGVKNATGFAPRYKERLSNWSEQINLGVSKGFLTLTEADKFKIDLEHLQQVEAKVSSAGYQKAELDDMEGQFTAFNVRLTQAMNKPAPKVQSAPTPGVQPAATQSAPTTAKTPAKTIPKAPAKPAKPKPPARKK